MDHIVIQGARTHNLKNINLSIPRNKLVVITGLSGSGKSSLAFDTLYAEGQRRYVESLSAYARQFLSLMEKPDVDHIDGLSPAISIEQKSTSHNPRSTVGTITEIYDYLRVLFARAGEPICPTHQNPLSAQTITQMVEQTLALPEDTKIMVVSPVIQNRKGQFIELFEKLKQDGFIRVKINHQLYELDSLKSDNPELWPVLDKRKNHFVSVIIDRLSVKAEHRARLAESLETAIQLSNGLAHIENYVPDNAPTPPDQKPLLLFSSKFACPHCEYSLPELTPRLFSFNSPMGACGTCDGLGVQSFMDADKIITNSNLSLAGGAIRQWDRNHLYYFNILNSLAKHYKFDLEIPFQKLSKKIQNIILHGSGSEQIVFNFFNDAQKTIQRREAFEGIIPNFTRRYRDTDSEYIRTELAKYLSTQPCPTCHGQRLNESARSVFIAEKSLPELTEYSIQELGDFFNQLSIPGWRGTVATRLTQEINSRLKFLINVGLDYLSLSRRAETLSGGEAQRIRLASQIGAGLVGVLYVLDEPSIGLHPRDTQRLINTLLELRDMGNSVIVVEHDESTIRQADYIVDIGPGAGIHGGEVIAAGIPSTVSNHPDSLTGAYLSGRQTIPVPEMRKPITPDYELVLTGASGHNLKNLTVSFPLGLLTCITGVSGSGKSSLINETLYPQLAKLLNNNQSLETLPIEKITGLELIDKIIAIDQSPIGRTPRSNSATYTGLLTPIRELFAQTPLARERGYAMGRFSFNIKGGRCEACRGDGLITVEMHFLPDVFVPCDQCQGKRYNAETLEVTYRHKNIHEILNLTVEQAYDFFQAIPTIAQKLQTLIMVGLGYITLGQSATTLSGGEAQRVKLSKELSKRDTGKTIYILDEPTTGLHFHDVKQLISVLTALRDRGNTVIVIEHHLDLIKTADWIIDLGPEGGHRGGEILAIGTPEMLAQQNHSFTGQALKELFNMETT